MWPTAFPRLPFVAFKGREEEEKEEECKLIENGTTTISMRVLPLWVGFTLLTSLLLNLTFFSMALGRHLSTDFAPAQLLYCTKYILGLFSFPLVTAEPIFIYQHPLKMLSSTRSRSSTGDSVKTKPFTKEILLRS